MKKLIWIGCLSYFVIGLAHVVLGSILPVLLNHYDQNYSAGGELIFSQFAGFLAGVLVSPFLNRRFGKRGGIVIATGHEHSFPIRRSPHCSLCLNCSAWAVYVRDILHSPRVLQQASARC